MYVDDVVDALILAAEKEEAVGERFLISGPDLVTWREFYAAYERILGVESVVSMPVEEIERINRQGNSVTLNLKMLGKDPLRVMSSTYYGLRLKHLLRHYPNNSSCFDAPRVIKSARSSAAMAIFNYSGRSRFYAALK